MLREAYSGTGRPVDVERGPVLSFDEACRLLLEAYPGIAMGEPERVWERQPHIATLKREIMDVHSRRNVPAMGSGGFIGSKLA